MILRTHLFLLLTLLATLLPYALAGPRFGPRVPEDRREAKPRNPIVDSRQLKAEQLRRQKKKRSCPRGVDGCKCPASKTYCFNGCVDVLTDRSHCGDCGFTCAMDELCVEGTCECMGTLCPNVGCVDLQNDYENCGMCGIECGRGSSCENGACVCYDELKSHCDQGCTNTLTDTRNCGDCDYRCASGAKCSKGKCQCVGKDCHCGNGKTPWCGGCSFTRLDDPKNCGSCGNVCTGGQVCDEGRCECPEGHTLWAGACVQGQHDLNVEL